MTSQKFSSQDYYDLCVAARDGQLAQVERYVQQGVHKQFNCLRINDVDSSLNGHTPLTLACYNNQAKVVVYLIQNGLDPFQPIETHINWPGHTALHLASSTYEDRGSDALSKILIYAPGDLDIRSTTNNMTPLIHAAQTNDKSGATKLLLKNGANPDLKSKHGDTALHFACWKPKQNLDRAKLLVDYGAELNIQNKDGMTPLSIALGSCSDKKIISFLIQSGAKVDVPSSEGQASLHFAAMRNNKEAIDQILSSVTEPAYLVNMQDHEGKTPLFFAVEQQDLAIVKKLTKHGADLFLKDAAGQDVVEYARSAGDESIFNFLASQQRRQKPVDSRPDGTRKRGVWAEFTKAVFAADMKADAWEVIGSNQIKKTVECTDLQLKSVLVFDLYQREARIEIKNAAQDRLYYETLSFSDPKIREEAGQALRIYCKLVKKGQDAVAIKRVSDPLKPDLSPDMIARTSPKVMRKVVRRVV